MTNIESKYGSNFVQIEESPYGVGPNHKMFVDCDTFVDSTKFEELHEEVVVGLSIIPQEDMKWPKFGGSMHYDKYKNILLESEILSEVLLTDRDKEIIANMNNQQIRKYLYFSKGILKPWAFTIYLRSGDFSKKTEQHKQDWEPVAEYFPKVKEFILSLPFKSVGRALFFCTDGFRDVPIHRDDLPKTHYDHGMNFFFEASRESYIYDPATNSKFYIDKNCKSYFFNNRDYHGVDAENRFRYTLRIDGTFNDDMIEPMCLYPDGAVMRHVER